MAIGGEVRHNNAAIDGSDTNASLSKHYTLTDRGTHAIRERGTRKGRREKGEGKREKGKGKGKRRALGVYVNITI
jgi:hypothetical protein